MFKVLLATDGSEYSEKAARYMRQLCERIEDCEITALYVKELGSNALGATGGPSLEAIPNGKVLQQQLEQQATSALTAAQKALSPTGQRITTRSVWGRPSDAICRIAEDEKFDLVVLGRRGRGHVAGLLLGSVSDRVSHCVKVPVLIVHELANKAQ
ncbi:MAG: hypothetical protein A2Y60_01735 [Chloroflexi bacterium RBG_13_54_9]|nr:MAG: hypothetical protein A2Y60_01735 [Chloroflexi bacterium RBG_13_54_9]